METVKEVPSIPETNPDLALSNVFKPTPKKRIILGMIMKIVGIGFVTLGGTLLAMVALISDMSKTLLVLGILLNISGLLGGAIGEAIILFSEEKPVSSLFRAAEQIQLNPTQITISSDSQPNECLTNPQQLN